MPFPYAEAKAIDYPFAIMADKRYPLLQLAAGEQRPAHSYRVEWLQDEWVDGRWEQRNRENYTQIIRTPFSPRDESDRDLYRALERHLSDVENTLWYGIPSYESSARNGHPLGMCGGVLHYLGRTPIAGVDIVCLRPLQDCVLLRDRNEPGGSTVHEFLSEFSLQVSPALSLQPYAPKKAINAWPQGSSLKEQE